MKFFALVCLLASLSTTVNAQTAADQVAGLRSAQLREIDAGLFTRGNIAIQVQSDGSISAYSPLDSALVPATKVKAIRVGKLFSGNSEALHYLYTDERHGDQHIQRNASGSGGGADKEDYAELDALVGQPFTLQLAKAGFTPIGTQNAVWTRLVDNSPIVVTIENEVLTGVYKPAEGLKEKLKGAVVIGYSEQQDRWGAINSSVRVQNAFAKFDIVAGSYGRLENVELFKDLKDVKLSDLGLKLPEVQKDRGSDFNIGGVNPTDVILKLLGLGGTSIGQIENAARVVDGCASGDKLLGQSESLLKVMAEDNEKVRKMGVTHQELAKPFLYAQAILDGSYGSLFTLHGTEYKVSAGPSPMCGQLRSPFNDNYATSISFLKITNLKTTKTINYSKLHPYLINQYGFYGSHENRSYVSPEAIVEVFDYLQKP